MLRWDGIGALMKSFYDARFQIQLLTIAFLSHPFLILYSGARSSHLGYSLSGPLLCLWKGAILSPLRAFSQQHRPSWRLVEVTARLGFYVICLCWLWIHFLWMASSLRVLSSFDSTCSDPASRSCQDGLSLNINCVFRKTPAPWLFLTRSISRYFFYVRFEQYRRVSKTS